MGWTSAGFGFASLSMDRPDYRGFRISACPDYRGSTVYILFCLLNCIHLQPPDDIYNNTYSTCDRKRQQIYKKSNLKEYFCLASPPDQKVKYKFFRTLDPIND
ncbi:hypothetical protein AVEN_158176-1 [Araneus ventricosus]|uniref:Uncharacterized protein n=1 Tax=Araneus ventricosus TaxID=182803 RepID=A0A4Y2G763_ARAVE|nr:hypothetical protein AVEN_158176-1 [Araneus ventricosus]